MNLKRVPVLIFFVIPMNLRAMEPEIRGKVPHFINEGKRLNLELQFPLEMESISESLTDSFCEEKLGTTDCELCFEEKSIDTTLACHHKFCFKCIIKWKRNAYEQLCPCCKRPLVFEKWSCSICKGEFKGEENLVFFSCGCGYCNKCANQIIIKNPKEIRCPTCGEMVRLDRTPTSTPREFRNINTVSTWQQWKDGLYYYLFAFGRPLTDDEVEEVC